MHECVDCRKCYDGKFLQNCDNCANCSFCKNCVGCHDCFGCVNLHNKSYWFLNKPLKKEEWEGKLRSLDLGTYSQISNLKKSFKNFVVQFPQQFAHLMQCENCAGDHLVQCKNTKDSYFSKNTENCKHLTQTIDMKNSYDVNYMENSEWIVDSFGAYRNHNMRFGNTVYGASDSDYCDFCVNNIRNCFGCIGMKHAEYCILNKQYSKAEYERLRDKVIEHMKKTGEWGEFFPMQLSPFSYNETVAHEYHPLTKKEALGRGLQWKDEEKNDYQLATISTIPNNIKDVSDSIVKEVLVCETCNKNYQIQKQELKFYRTMVLPIPIHCPDCRHHERMTLRNPRSLWMRTCDKCSEEIQTTFAPERAEKVYCEKCYLECVN